MHESRHISNEKTALNRQAMARFLVSERVVTPDGDVFSWVNSQASGYHYPEAAALWLLWSGWRADVGLPTPDGETQKKVARRLAHLWACAGGVGKNGTIYLFDTVLALLAIARCEQRGLLDAQPVRNLATQVLPTWSAEERPVRPAGLVQTRWSTRWGAHLLKVLYWIRQIDEVWGGFDSAIPAISNRIARPTWRCNPHLYTHEACYALEGRLLLGEWSQYDLALLHRFAEIQRPDGSLPSHVGSRGASRTDCTAQAIRLWRWVDAERFKTAITCGLHYLACRQTRQGAILYGSQSVDQNTWSTLFADQALATLDELPALHHWI